MNDDLQAIASRRIGLALSGGGVRGLAHIGVIKALDDLGIRPAVVAGTSAGSLIGAGLAAGMSWRELAAMARSVFWPKLLNGKPAGVRCVQLTDDNRCLLFGKPERPAVCVHLRPSQEMCGDRLEEAMRRLTVLEMLTTPS